MTDTTTTPPPGEGELDFAALYEKNFSAMVGVAVKKFGIAEMDAETLAQDVLFTFFLRQRPIEDPRGYLIGGVCNASRNYLRSKARLEALPDNFSEEPDPHLTRVRQLWPDQLVAREAFGCVTARCQLALRLRYLEGYSIPEIAKELGITPKYAAKLVSSCLEQAERRYTKKERERRDS